MNIEDIVSKYVFSILEMILLHIFFYKVIRKCDYKNLKRPFLKISLNLILVIFISILVSNNLLKIIFITLISYTVLVSLYKNIISKGKVLLYFALFMVLLLVCDFISLNIIAKVYNGSYFNLIENNYMIKIIASCLSKLLFIFILKYIINLIMKKHIVMVPEYNYIVAIILLFTIVIAISLTELFINYDEIYLMLIAISLFIINLSVFFTINVLSEYYEKKENGKIIEIKNKLLLDNYLQQEKISKETRRLKHDLQNDLNNLYLLLNEKNIDTAKKYIKQRIEQVPTSSPLISTGNNLIDVILTQKLEKSENNNIKFISKIKIDESLVLDKVDISSLLTNLLDNAIEANLKIEDIEKRFIEIRLERYRGYFMLRVSNSCMEDPSSIIKTRKTTKENKDNHGIGIGIIEDIVKKYSGILNYKYDNKVFITTILF